MTNEEQITKMKKKIAELNSLSELAGHLEPGLRGICQAYSDDQQVIWENWGNVPHLDSLNDAFRMMLHTEKGQFLENLLEVWANGTQEDRSELFGDAHIKYRNQPLIATFIGEYTFKNHNQLRFWYGAPAIITETHADSAGKGLLCGAYIRGKSLSYSFLHLTEKIVGPRTRLSSYPEIDIFIPEKMKDQIQIEKMKKEEYGDRWIVRRK